MEGPQSVSFIERLSSFCVHDSEVSFKKKKTTINVPLPEAPQGILDHFCHKLDHYD